MSRKELSDFGGDYQAFADYLESAECTNDEGYDVIADEKGNVFTPTDGDWTKGHGHKNDKNGYDRSADDEKSKGRPWKNRWLKYSTSLNLSQNDIELLSKHNASKILVRKQ